MHPGVLKALEFDRIVEAVSRLAVTPMGAARLARLQPSTDPRSVAAALAATSEARAFLAAHGEWPLEAPADLDATLTALAIEGRALDTGALVGLARFLASVETTRAAIRQASGHYPILRSVAESAASFEREVSEIARTIDAAGQVVDEASPELRVIRDRLRRQRARLRGTLESFLRNKETAKYLQDQIVTDRNGRYVLLVKAEHRAAIPGIVHGSSASGASLFLEPLSTVEVNNEVVALEEHERAEVRRVLLALADAFRRRAADLKRTIDAAVELDVIQARARFSALVDGVEPVLAADGRLELRAARHPLLVPAVRELAGETAGAGADGESAPAAPAGAKRPTGPVPVDLVVVPPTQVLVITGPNTGGKTVALKTAGLLALMAQAGLHIPAASGSQTTVFRSVFADIGDEQSIVTSLSTFSWHMTNIAAMDRALALPALVLLDEVGAGTDPVEGGALGVAIVEHFRQRRALVLATTHDEAVKTYATTTAGVACAAFGFDPESFAPTYRLVYGSPGRSLALEIAARLGLPASIIETARAQRSEREAQLAEQLAKIDRELAALEHERRLAARERQTLAEEAARLRAREEELHRREEVAKRRASERLDAAIREARREIDAIVADLKTRVEHLAEEAARRARGAGVAVPAGRLSTGELGTVRAAARAALDAVERRHRASFEAEPSVAALHPTPAAATAPGVGARVIVTGLGLEGTVRALHDREAEIDVHGKRFRAAIADLRVVAEAASSPPPVSVRVEWQPRDAGPTELNVIGCSADEAVARTEKFLDEAVLADHRTVRVIHGYGTGQLRRAIAALLSSHPLVARFGAAPEDQGGGGVTIVELKE
jgi:DNA mismatch repair protein MutS2